MKYEAGESYEAWVERVRMYEHGWALQQIASGQPADKILDQMSQRIIQKCMHPLLKALQTTTIDTAELERGKKHYEETYINKVKPAADHVVEDEK
jgi:glutamyl-tRNA reductase